MIKLVSSITLDAFQGGAQVQYIRVEANDLNVEGARSTARGSRSLRRTV